MTFCSKSMLNGPCGGYSAEHMCEVDPGMPCGRVRIYERLKTLGQLDRFNEIVAAKKHARSRPPDRLRGTTLWEVEEMDPGNANEPEEDAAGG